MLWMFTLGFVLGFAAGFVFRHWTHSKLVAEAIALFQAAERKLKDAIESGKDTDPR